MLNGRSLLQGGIVALLIMGSVNAMFANNVPDGDEGHGTKPPTERAVPVRVTVGTDKKVYRSGEPIKITLLAKNTQKSDVSLQFSSGQMFDIEIRRGKDKNGEKVWQWAEGRMFTMALQSKTLTTNQSLTFQESYGSKEMERANGKPAVKLTPGIYTLVGTITTMGRTPRPFGTTTITVK